MKLICDVNLKTGKEFKTLQSKPININLITTKENQDVVGWSLRSHYDLEPQNFELL